MAKNLRNPRPIFIATFLALLNAFLKLYLEGFFSAVTLKKNLLQAILKDILFLFSIGILVPLWEEIFYRRFLLGIFFDGRPSFLDCCMNGKKSAIMKYIFAIL